MVNLIDRPRQVTVMNFDFLYIEASADRIAEAIREDVCSFYGISWSLSNYLDIAIQNL